MMEPWYRSVTSRKEVRERRSFNPDEFEIALEHVVAGTAPDGYTRPERFFSRTCVTRTLRDTRPNGSRNVAFIRAGRDENIADVRFLLHASDVPCNNLITVELTRVHTVIGRHPAATMQKIDVCLKAALGLP
jgi:hypothetical protein